MSSHRDKFDEDQLEIHHTNIQKKRERNKQNFKCVNVREILEDDYGDEEMYARFERFHRRRG
jgi:hypothetical protein